MCPMTGPGLASAIEAVFGSPVDNEKLQDFCEAVVTYIQQNATVLPGIAVQVNPSTGTGATTAPGMIE